MARKKAAKKTGTAAIETVEDDPVAGRAPTAAPVADDKPGPGKKICPHCHAKIAARSSACPACHTQIAPKVKKVVKPARSVVASAKRQPRAASNTTAQPVALEAGIRFLKAAGSVEEADKTWAIIREVARAVVTPF
jgi:ribosomal protein L40E